MTARQPSLFLSHGGGPSFLLDDPMMQGINKNSTMDRFLRSVAKQLPAKPKAAVFVSAHWETSDGVLVNTASKHTLYYDYGGFPEHTYHLDWAPSGDPALAARVKELIEAAGITAGTDSKRGLDHGVFIPGMLAFPVNLALPYYQDSH